MKAIMENHPDKIIMSASAALTMLGLIFVYSASGPFCQFFSPPKPTWYFLQRQALWAAVAIVSMFAAYRLDYQAIIKLSPVLTVLALLALIAVFPLSGARVKRWISLGGFTFQPSEFFKIALVAFMARFTARNMGQEIDLKRYVPALIVIGLGVLLIVREPDLGTTSLVMVVAACLLFLSGFPKKYILVVGLAFAVLASVLVFGLGYERDRVDQFGVTLKNPFDRDASYQTRQSLVSLGSGGLIGKGLGNGGQKHLFLPARHTDFIISAAAEEGGFAVVALILVLFSLIGWSGYNIAKSAIDIEGSFFAWGLMLFITLQALINFGVALGLFPITGMTLPFLSYGGSSLFVCSIATGMIASVARRSRSPLHYFRRVRV
jgi:cell division protein FtsW